ncbi:MAG: cobalamin-dependent protein [Spirochaetes bacterium]|nr:cobalamin-dependent protein [Spirochaetota bacterium]
MKVLLVSANSVRAPYYVYPLGLDYVAAAIADRHEVRVADINDDGSTDRLLETIHDFAPDAIGLSLRNIDNVEANDVRGFVKAYRSLVELVRTHTDATVILGGSGFTIFPAQLMRELGADYGVIGEGERLADLLAALEAGTDPAGITGVITAGGAERIPPPLDRPFTRVPAPYPYSRFYLERGGMMNLQTKRGCNFRCIYCTYPHIEGTALRLIQADEVADTAIALQASGARYLFITDSVFNTSFEHSREVARAFSRRGLSIPWGAFFAPSRPPDDYFRTLRSAGLTHAEFGTEALSPSMLASYRKPFNTDDVFAAHAQALGAGLHVAHYLLLGGPGETRDTLRETLDNAERLERTVVFFFCGMRIYPHTELYDIALKEGQITESDDLLEPVFYRSPGVPADEIIRIVEERARGRDNWIIGSGGKKIARLIARMHRQGHTGPLWEHIVR